MAVVRVAFATSLLALAFFVALRAEPAADPAPDALLRLVRSYSEWTRVSPRPSRSPTLCSAGIQGPPRSASEHAETHGRKYYHLFARDADAYRAGGVQPDGQTLVKLSWFPKDGEVWPPGIPAGLFAMHKSAGEWTYAVTTPDGSRFLERGRIASCAGCHDPVRPDRLFGLPR